MRALDALHKQTKEDFMVTAKNIQAAIDAEVADLKNSLAAITAGVGNLRSEIQTLKDSPVDVDLTGLTAAVDQIQDAATKFLPVTAEPGSDAATIDPPVSSPVDDPISVPSEDAPAPSTPADDVSEDVALENGDPFKENVNTDVPVTSEPAAEDTTK